MSWLRSSVAAVLAVVPLLAAAVEDREAITVTALRGTVDKSYRRMVEGMDLFERMHALAPGATLRYKVIPRKPETRMSGIELAVVADTFELPVAVASDGTFTLERNRQALREDASVRPNRKAGTMTWRTEIRTPGLPADTRRLGDLRLECRTGMQAGLVSNYPTSVLARVFEAMLDTPEFCDERNPPYVFFAERPLFSVTLQAGARKETQSVRQLYAASAPKEDLRYCDCEVLLDRAYMLPLGDRTWPDDTRVYLEYMDVAGSDPGDAVWAGSSKSDITATFGEGRATRFGSGFEVREYRYGASEFVVLFTPEGTVAKTRLR